MESPKFASCKVVLPCEHLFLFHDPRDVIAYALRHHKGLENWEWEWQSNHGNIEHAANTDGVFQLMVFFFKSPDGTRTLWIKFFADAYRQKKSKKDRYLYLIFFLLVCSPLSFVLVLSFHSSSHQFSPFLILFLLCSTWALYMAFGNDKGPQVGSVQSRYFLCLVPASIPRKEIFNLMFELLEPLKNGLKFYFAPTQQVER